MKILYFTKYAQNAGSSRMRSFQYFPYWEKEGFQVEASPLFNEKYLTHLYAGKSTWKESIAGYIKRFFKLFCLRKYDRIVIEKELFPYLPAWTEKVLHFLKVGYIVDYDDAIFHNYDQSTHPLIKKLLHDKIDRVMKYSSTVVAGNSYLAERAKLAGASAIEIIPTVIDLNRYTVQEKTSNTPFIVGWIGTKSTFEKHLLPQKAWIQNLAAIDPEIEFHIIGIAEDHGWGDHVKWIPWSADSENEEINQFHVGIMPLKDSLWEKGKCAYKLIQYGACGIPGIAADIGMNAEVTIPNQTGLLVEEDSAWVDAILSLKNNEILRQQLGANARKQVASKFCLQVTAGKWFEILTRN